MKLSRSGYVSLAILAAGLFGLPANAASQPESQITAEMVASGKQAFHNTCAHCHGLNMVNSGTTVYDLRKFPLDQRDRFLNSVTNGKGNMPSFKDVLDPAQMALLWAYVGTRGGKEMSP